MAHYFSQPFQTPDRNVFYTTLSVYRRFVAAVHHSSPFLVPFSVSLLNLFRRRRGECETRLIYHRARSLFTASVVRLVTGEGGRKGKSSFRGLPYLTSTEFWDFLPPLCPQHLLCLLANLLHFLTPLPLLCRRRIWKRPYSPPMQISPDGDGSGEGKEEAEPAGL